VPPRVDYALTPAGTALLPALSLLKSWSEDHTPGLSRARATATA
jgi:DNA-binding HxlR family transcriptional regulator